MPSPKYVRSEGERRVFESDEERRIIGRDVVSEKIWAKRGGEGGEGLRKWGMSDRDDGFVVPTLLFRGHENTAAFFRTKHAATCVYSSKPLLREKTIQIDALFSSISLTTL